MTGVEVVWADNVPKPKMAYSPAIRAGDWLFVAGQLASDFASGLPTAVVPANPYLVSPAETQGRFVLDNISSAMAPAGAALSSDVVRLSRWFTGAVVDDASSRWHSASPAPSAGRRSVSRTTCTRKPTHSTPGRQQ